MGSLRVGMYEGNDIAEFYDLCREAGIKATHQRMEIFAALRSASDHPDVESIYESVRRSIPSVSLDTVYRTLRLFEAHGIVSRIGSLHERTRFDVDTTPHCHFVCAECGRTVDVHRECSRGIESLPDVEEIGSVLDVYVEVRGVCSECLRHELPEEKHN